MFLYRQIGIGTICTARLVEVEFPKAITIASRNFADLVTSRHGGVIEEVGDMKLSGDELFKRSQFVFVGGAIRFCPDSVPQEDKDKFESYLKSLKKDDSK